ncbi:hypothetical protein [Treponema sp.]|uniref:hypothetical protein n=1 Tax=Treponema sp. TaxID=166 RepID=UPI00388D3D39
MAPNEALELVNRTIMEGKVCDEIMASYSFWFRIQDALESQIQKKGGKMMAAIATTIKVDLDDKLIQDIYNKGHSEGYDLGYKVGFDRGCRLADPMNAPIADDIVSMPMKKEA